jgi:hypothetical protein
MNLKSNACMLLAVASMLSMAAVAAAQNPPQLPKVLWIYREDAKPARGAAHARVEQGFARYWAKNKVAPYIGLEAVSGNATEVMFISGYQSLAEMESDYQTFGKASSGPQYEALARQEADLVNGVRSRVAILRPDLSYLPDKMTSIVPRSRYFSITTFRVRLGRDDDFAAGIKLFQNAFEKMKREQPYATFQVAMGAPEGTYLLVSPMKSFKEIDDEYANQKAFLDAMGEENMKNLMKGAGDVFITMETNVYAFNPNMSNVSKEFAAADPKFWTPKPLPAPKKDSTKPATEAKPQ